MIIFEQHHSFLSRILCFVFYDGIPLVYLFALFAEIVVLFKIILRLKKSIIGILQDVCHFDQRPVILSM